MSLPHKILLLLFILLVGCSEAHTPELRIGSNVWPGNEPLYLARENGYFDPQKIHLVEYSSASQVIQSFRNGLIDAAALTLDETLLLLERGEELTIVLVMDISDGGDVIIARKDIASMAELRGRHVAVENTALGAYVLERAMDIAKLDKNTVNIVELDVNEHEKAFLQGEVDALVTFEPVRSKLLAVGGHILFDSKQIPGEIVDVLVVKNDYLRRYPKSIQHLRQGWYLSLDAIKNQPRESAKILGQRMQLNIDDTLASYAGLILPDQNENQRLLFGQPDPPLLITARKLAQLMFNHKLLEKKLNPEVLLPDNNDFSHE